MTSRKLPARALKRLGELDQLLRSWNGESSAIGEISEPLREIVGGEKSAVYTLRTIGGQTGVGEVASVGVTAIAQFMASMQSVTQGFVMYDPSRPARAQRNRAVTFEDLHRQKVASGSIAHAGFWRSNGLHRDDQLRVLLCDGPTAVAWAGAFQAEPFQPWQRELLQRAVPALRRRLVLESRLRQGDLASAALPVALEHLGSAAFIVSAHGVIAFANSSGRALLDQDGATTRARLLDGIRHSSPGFTPLVVQGGGAMYLATLPVDHGRARVAAASARWALTARQSQVLALLVEGCANSVIAARLDLSVRTVEVHVAAMFVRVGVGNRAELVARVFSASSQR